MGVLVAQGSADDPVGGAAAVGCTVRKYGFDAQSHRVSQNTYPAGADGACQTASGASTVNHSYVSSDRLSPTGTDAGLAYDAFGRTTTLPAVGTANAGAQSAVLER